MELKSQIIFNVYAQCTNTVTNLCVTDTILAPGLFVINVMNERMLCIKATTRDKLRANIIRPF